MIHGVEKHVVALLLFWTVFLVGTGTVEETMQNTTKQAARSKSLWKRVGGLGLERNNWHRVSSPYCTYVFTTPSGTITSPGYPSNYFNNLYQCWLIQAPEMQVIYLTFDDFQLEGSMQCYDFLDVYDGDTLVGTYCGSMLPPDIVSTSNSLLLVFTSDASRTMRGFQASYVIQQPMPDCTYVFTTPSGTITSPGYPSSYFNNLYQCWLIQAPEMQVIYLTFDDFQLEEGSMQCYDYLDVYDGDTLVGTYCGSMLPLDIVSTSNSLLLVFTSDASFTMRGFQASYVMQEPMPACEWMTNIRGYIYADIPASPFYFFLCWEIEIPSGTLEMKFTHLDLENSMNCAVEAVSISAVFGPDNLQLVRTVCGSRDPDVIRVPSNAAFVTVESNEFQRLSGFTLEYGKSGACTGVVPEILNRPGMVEITSSMYTNNMACYWTIELNQRVEMRFTRFDVESGSSCKFDYVSITDEGSEPQRFCGSRPPFTVVSTSNTVNFHFCTDGDLTESGFTMEFRAYGGAGIEGNDPTCGFPHFNPFDPSDGVSVGGRPAREGSWPWQVDLQRGGRHTCGGCILSSVWVLTAAHCMYRRQRSEFTAIVGQHRLDATETEEQVLSIDNIIIHENYQNYSNDIALIRLATPIVFGMKVEPVCLPQNDIEEGTLVITTGWGSIRDETHDVQPKPTQNTSSDETADVQPKPTQNPSSDETPDVQPEPKHNTTSAKTQEVQSKPKQNTSSDETPDVQPKPKHNTPADETQDLNPEPKPKKSLGDGQANVLHEVYMSVISTNQCNRPEWHNGVVNHHTMFCAGHEGGRHSCQTGSGGPLVYLEVNRYILHGLSSWPDIGCGDERWPGVYTRVTNFISWINEQTHGAIQQA